MKTNEIKDLTIKQLREKLVEERMSLTKMRLSHAVSPMENPMKMREVKKLIARIRTEITSKTKGENASK